MVIEYKIKKNGKKKLRNKTGKKAFILVLNENGEVFDFGSGITSTVVIPENYRLFYGDKKNLRKKIKNENLKFVDEFTKDLLV